MANTITRGVTRTLGSVIDQYLKTIKRRDYPKYDAYIKTITTPIFTPVDLKIQNELKQHYEEIIARDVTLTITSDNED